MNRKKRVQRFRMLLLTDSKQLDLTTRQVFRTRLEEKTPRTAKRELIYHVPRLLTHLKKTDALKSE